VVVGCWLLLSSLSFCEIHFKMSLTPGVISRMTEKREDVTDAVVQVLEIKNIEKTPTSKPRYKALLSDGTNTTRAMISTQLNEMVIEEEIRPNTIIKLASYVTDVIRSKVVVIVLDVQVVSQYDVRIGNPMKTESSSVAQKPQNGPQSIHPQQSSATRQYAPPANGQSRLGLPRGNGGIVQQTGIRTTDGNVNVTPIQALTVYSNCWTIKARVTKKSDIRRWDKGPTNQGTLFSIDLMDKSGGEIRGTFFKEACDMYFERIQEGGVYFFSKGKLKMSNKRFTNLKHEYEITFDKNAVIEECQDDSSIKAINMERTPIASIQDLPSESTVDIIGIAVEVGSLSEFTSKAGKPLVKLEIVLADESKCSIRATVWGDKARDIEAKLSNCAPNPVIGIKGARVSDWGGKSLSTGGGGSVVIEPELPEVQVLRQWHQSGADTTSFVPLSQNGRVGGGANTAPKPVNERHTIASIKDLNLGGGDKPDYIDIKATVIRVMPDKMWYYSAPSENNNCKVVECNDGQWFCEKKNEYYPNKQNRYILRGILSDFTGETYFTMFNDQACAFLNGTTADEMQELKENDENSFNQVIKDAMFQTGLVRLSIKREVHQEQERVKATVLSFQPLDCAAECNFLLDAISLYD